MVRCAVRLQMNNHDWGSEVKILHSAATVIVRIPIIDVVMEHFVPSRAGNGRAYARPWYSSPRGSFLLYEKK